MVLNEYAFVPVLSLKKVVWKNCSLEVIESKDSGFWQKLSLNKN